MARLVLNGALKRTAGGISVSPMAKRYAFIAHPACCPKCSTMDTRITGRVYSIPDVGRISHPNCLCSTVELPDDVGIDLASVVSFTANPVGGILRQGFNFGKSFVAKKLTAGNLADSFSAVERRATKHLASGMGLRGKGRVKVNRAQKAAYTRLYNKDSDNWIDFGHAARGRSRGGVIKPKAGESFGDYLQRSKEGMLKVKKTRTFRMSNVDGSVPKSMDIKSRKMKSAAKVRENRKSASRETKSLAKALGIKVIK